MFASGQSTSRSTSLMSTIDRINSNKTYSVISPLPSFVANGVALRSDRPKSQPIVIVVVPN